MDLSITNQSTESSIALMWLDRGMSPTFDIFEVPVDRKDVSTKSFN